MRPTVEYLEEKFMFLNRQCFGGKLRPIPIVLSNASTFVGKFCYRRKSVFGVVKLSDMLIRISVRYDLEEDEIIDILLHEMIHYYICVNGIRDTSSHGVRFVEMMNRFNAQYGRHVSVRHETKSGSSMARQMAQEREEKKSVFRKHYIGVAELVDGSVCVVRAASTRVREINRLMPEYYRLKSLKWYGTVSPFWNKYPNCISPKLYRIDGDALDYELETMVLLPL